jgi:hypothetical protein
MTGPLPDARLPDPRTFGFRAGDVPTENRADGTAEPIERERQVDSSEARFVPVERIGNGRDGITGTGSNGTLGVMKEALGHLERACRAMIAESTAAAETARKRVADVRSEAEAEALRARLEAQAEIADLRKELEASRMECADLARQLDVEKANRARLTADVQPIQRLTRLTGVTSAVEAVDPAGPPLRDPSTIAAPSDAPHVNLGLDFDPSDYARQLVDNIEAVYAADVASGLMPDELVARLAGNLTYGAEVFARRLGSAAGPGTRAFDEQVTIVLQTRGDAAFGRHLAVAAYGYERLRK